MMEGWTKNLVLLFPHALTLAAWRLLDIVLFLLPLLFFVMPNLVVWQRAAILLLWVRTLLRFYRRVARLALSVCRLRALSAWVAAVYRSADPKLDAAQTFSSRRVEGQGIQGVRAATL